MLCRPGDAAVQEPVIDADRAGARLHPEGQIGEHRAQESRRQSAATAVGRWAATDSEIESWRSAEYFHLARILSEPPCTMPDTERLAAMCAGLRAWPRAEMAFEAPGVTVFHVRHSTGS
jgi:hypothetical protein